MDQIKLTEAQRLEHNKAFDAASALVLKEMLLHERMHMPKPGWWLRWKFKRALARFDRVLALNPENWSAMWLIGKAHQRLGDIPTALSWFEHSYQVNPSQPDVAREASMCAMDIGLHDVAIVFAHRATQIEPDNAGLHANLALCYVLAGQLPKADECIKRSLSLDPTDSISQTIDNIIKHFANNGQRPPTTTATLAKYWQKNRP